MPDEVTPGLEALQNALADGDMDRVREVLVSLDKEDQDLLRQELGAQTFERTRRSATRGGRGAKKGKVLVLPGIMGSLLDVVDAKGEADRIWLSAINIIRGRIKELELTIDGEPAKKGTHVTTAGLYRQYYVPMLLELDNHWHVRPFAFDWREPIERSAARLDGEVKAFGDGGPVHLIAHSMGGLVSRCFISRYRDTWNAMNDPTGKGRGGRLIQLGTPNRGSFSIAQVLTGQEDALKKLALFDFWNGMDDLLDVVGTFSGMYQMLPSQLASLGDDHGRLYQAATWGAFKTEQKHLDGAKKLHDELKTVIDPQRLVYVAGYDRPTIASVKVNGPGKLTFGTTRDGDGKVTHALGFLEGVRTFFVDEDHGALATNARVLAAIHDLLERGTTTALAATKPTRRSAAARRGGHGRALGPPQAGGGTAGRAARQGAGPAARETAEAVAGGADRGAAADHGGVAGPHRGAGSGRGSAALGAFAASAPSAPALDPDRGHLGRRDAYRRGRAYGRPLRGSAAPAGGAGARLPRLERRAGRCPRPGDP